MKNIEIKIAKNGSKRYYVREENGNNAVGMSNEMYYRLHALHQKLDYTRSDGKDYWYDFGSSYGNRRRISTKRAAEILAEHGFTVDEYIRNLKGYGEKKWQMARWSYYVRKKIDNDRRRLDDDNVSDLLPTLDWLNDVDDAQSISTPIIETVEITEDGNEFRRFTVNNETVTYFNGELNFIKSDTYHASLAAYRNQYVVEVPDGRWKKFKRLDVDEFFQLMSERGACTFDEPEPTSLKPVDDFGNKFATLKAEYDKAEKSTAGKRLAVAEAEKEYNAAAKTSTAALMNLQRFLLDAREQLTKELLADIESPYEIAITAHNGRTYKTKLRGAFFLFGNVGEYISFLVSKEASCINWELATYDTLDKMKIAIEMLKAAIARGDKSFTFPTAEFADALLEHADEIHFRLDLSKTIGETVNELRRRFERYEP